MELCEVVVSAPGKVILHGEHAVMFGKTAIAGSLGLRSTITIKEVISEVPSIHLDLPAIDFETTILLKPIDQLLKSNEALSWREPTKIDHEIHIRNVEEFLNDSLPQFENLKNTQKNALRGFFYLLSGILGGTESLDNSLRVTVKSELTIGAGTGSSASYAVCLAGALLQLAKLKNGARSDEFTVEDKKLISAWAFNCEKIMHGAPSGIDNSTATYGALVSFRKGEDPYLLEFGRDLRVLLVDTRVSRETRVLAARVASLRQRLGRAVASVVDAIGHATDSAVEILKNLSKIEDQQEVNAQYQHLAEIWEMNHCLLASLGVSHAALEAVRARAGAHGLACKLTGAGGGGYAIVLVPPSTPQETVEVLTDELGGRGFGVTDTQLGGPGVTLDKTT